MARLASVGAWRTARPRLDAVDRAEEKRQRLVTQLTDGVHIRGDRDLLFQAIANLIDNAIKYTPSGGAIEVSMQNGADAAQIMIADSGPGIPPAARERVFERFYRLDASRTTPGSGLGLSLAAAVAKLHHIEIRLEDNRPGLRVVMQIPNAE